jgi:HK97 family phage portal protein
MQKQSKQPGKVKAALLNWLGVPLSLASGAFWSEMFGASTATGKPVSVDSAMQLSTVWACVRLLSETVSTLPLRVYRKRAGGGRDVATDHWLYALLCKSPNSEMTPGRFRLFIVASLTVRGNAYVEKRRIGGRIVALHPLLPQNVVVKRDPVNGRLIYRVTDDKGGVRTLQADDVMHIRGFGLDGICGMQPVGTGREIIGAATAANEASAKIFAQGMQASGILTVEGGSLNAEQRERIRTNLTTFSQSTAAGKLMVLEAGMKYQGITMNPESAQMLATRGFNVEEICRWWGVPPFMVGHMDKASSWAASVEAQNLHFLTSCLRPILDNIEQEIIRCLVPREEWDTIYAEFSVEGLLRADSAGRAAFYNSALQNGWMNRNQVCALENMPPIPGGEIYTVQTSLTPLEMLGKGPGQADAARAAMKAWLAALPLDEEITA